MFRSGTRIGWGHPLHDHGPDPDEYFARVSATAGGSPEKRLRLAVLLNAITHLRRGAQDAEEAARWVRGELDGVDKVHPKMIFDPPWSPEMMSEDAKFALGY